MPQEQTSLFDIQEMDITNAKQVKEVITSGNYDAVVHCAAWTAVDKAETDAYGTLTERRSEF